MLTYPNINPVIVDFGPVQMRWYGLMYVLGFSASYWLVLRQLQKAEDRRLMAHFENLNFALIISLLLGARLGYALFYNFSYYVAHPWEVLATWQGGMSFHGACLGVIIGGYLFCRKHGLPFLASADLYVVTMPVGLGLGRLGNFINGELYGRVTTLPWGMVFPNGGPLPRHPSQLYEFLLEGVLLFAILWRLKERRWPGGAMLAAFLLLYGLFRTLVETVRQPDPQLGFLFAGLTMGQLLSGTMMAGGLAIIWVIRRKK